MGNSRTPTVADHQDGTYERVVKAGHLVKGMSFSQRVWAVCARIPRGKVTTYREIARKLNSRGARAVGSALHRNPYAPEVPCHRVVGADGSLRGYAGGVQKKRELLRDEGIRFTNENVDLMRHWVRL